MHQLETTVPYKMKYWQGVNFGDFIKNCQYLIHQ